MQTRRQLLKQAFTLPLAQTIIAAPAAGFRILAEPNCISRESVAGFRSLNVSEALNVTLLCGVSEVDIAVASRLREQAAAGRWVIWESSPTPSRTQAPILGEIFGLTIGEPVPTSPDRLYIRYSRPHMALTRSFCAAIPVARSNAQTLAMYGNTKVAMKCAVGRGGLIFLGSMLGPNLAAEEPEARSIAAGILNF